jgi:peroxiredoxin family protein
MLRYHDFLDKFSKKSDGEYSMNTSRAGKLSILSAWSTDWIKKYVTYSYKVLQLIHNHSEVRLITCGTTMDEYEFGKIRIMVWNTHTFEKG